MYRLNLILPEDLRKLYADASRNLGVSYSDLIRIVMRASANELSLSQIFPYASGQILKGCK